jgi:CNP1-like family
MKTPPHPFIRLSALACLGLSLVLPLQASGDAYPREDGPVGFPVQNQPENPQWKEQDVRLPAYPRAGHLLELGVDMPGFHAFIDPQSLSAGKDKVVRFTSVLISDSGIWNVTYEGLHCGEERYRRFAYGNAGQWHAVTASDWQPLTVSGTGAYRKTLYFRYMCNPVEPYRGTDAILRRMQSPRQNIGD